MAKEQGPFHWGHEALHLAIALDDDCSPRLTHLGLPGEAAEHPRCILAPGGGDGRGSRPWLVGRPPDRDRPRRASAPPEPPRDPRRGLAHTDRPPPRSGNRAGRGGDLPITGRHPRAPRRGDPAQRRAGRAAPGVGQLARGGLPDIPGSGGHRRRGPAVGGARLARRMPPAATADAPDHTCPRRTGGQRARQSRLRPQWTGHLVQLRTPPHGRPDGPAYRPHLGAADRAQRRGLALGVRRAGQGGLRGAVAFPPGTTPGSPWPCTLPPSPTSPPGAAPGTDATATLHLPRLRGTAARVDLLYPSVGRAVSAWMPTWPS